MSRRHRRDRGFDPTGELVRDITTDVIRDITRDLERRSRRRSRRRRRRGGGFLGKLIKTWLWIVVATLVIVPATITQGWFFGTGVKGLVALPLILLGTWGVIAYMNLIRKPVAPLPATTNTAVALLPAQTDTWLETQRDLLPALVQDRLDSISTRLEALAPQVKSLGTDTPAAAEVRKLLSEELPELVHGYQKVPAALRTQSLHGGLSPERQLVEGLNTIDEQIGRLHEQLAANDLHALATHQRYLELKYKADEEEK